MTLRWMMASIHLLALGIGLGAIWARGRALEGSLEGDGLRRVFRVDALWGIAALLWVSTGLVRVFGGMEKGTQYYVHNHIFWTKMALFVLVTVLEIWPMTSIIGWRSAARRGEAVDTGRAPLLSRISKVQAVLLVLMIFAATAMARGLGG